MKKRILAFTLAELLMATLVMSIILTALAPVMTKRTLDNVNIGQSKNEKDGRLFLYNSMTTDLSNIWSDGTSSRFHKYSFTIPEGVYSIDVYVQSAGGGGGDTFRPDVYDKTYVAKASGRGPYSAAPLTVVKGMYDFGINRLIGGGGGGGGGRKYSVFNPDSQEACNLLGTGLTYVPSYSAGTTNTCVTNSGPGNGIVPIAGGVSVVGSTTKSYNIHTCWNGTTAGPGCSGYCTKTVCTFGAALNSCCNYTAGGKVKPCNFYLPTKDEMYSWWWVGSNHEYVNYAHVNLTTHAGSLSGFYTTPYLSGYDYCNYEAGALLNNGCIPGQYWTRTLTNGTEYTGGQTSSEAEDKIAMSIDNGTFYYIPNTGGARALDSRCLLWQNATKTTRMSGGGGGGAGGTIGLGVGSNAYKFSNKSLNPQPGWKISAHAGAPGRFGRSYSTFDSGDTTVESSGGTGETSTITVKDANGSTRGTFYATGGYGGGAGQHTNHGAAGSNGSCYYINSSGSRSYISCYFGGSNAESGTYNFLLKDMFVASYQSYSNGGKGSDSKVASGAPGQPGTSGSYTDITDASYSSYGAGGGGGMAGISSTMNGSTASSNSGQSSGGYGGNGYAEVGYRQTVRNSSGGGGGGGAFAILQGISVQPGFVVEVYVGGGGRRGISNYHNGGRSGVRVMNSSGSTVMQYILSGGIGGENGESADSNGRGYALGGNGGEETTCDSCASYRKVRQNGRRGDNSSNSEHIDSHTSFPYTRSGVYMGGNGGASGAGTSGGYGGFYTQWLNGVWNHVNSDNPDGLEVDFKAPSMIFGAMDYGTTGAGGGGGGWSWGTSADYFVNNNGRGAVGKGANGQDGYVFIMWDKPPES